MMKTKSKPAVKASPKQAKAPPTAKEKQHWRGVIRTANSMLATAGVRQ